MVHTCPFLSIGLRTPSPLQTPAHGSDPIDAPPSSSQRTRPMRSTSSPASAQAWNHRTPGSRASRPLAVVLTLFSQDGALTDEVRVGLTGSFLPGVSLLFGALFSYTISLLVSKRASDTNVRIYLFVGDDSAGASDRVVSRNTSAAFSRETGGSEDGFF